MFDKVFEMLAWKTQGKGKVSVLLLLLVIIMIVVSCSICHRSLMNGCLLLFLSNEHTQTSSTGNTEAKQVDEIALFQGCESHEGYAETGRQRSMSPISL